MGSRYALRAALGMVSMRPRQAELLNVEIFTPSDGKTDTWRCGPVEGRGERRTREEVVGEADST